MRWSSTWAFGWLVLWCYFGTGCTYTASLHVSQGAPADSRDVTIVPQLIPAAAAITAVAVTKTERVVVLGDDTGLLSFLDLGSGRLIRRVPVHTGKVLALAFDQDDAEITSVGADAAICKLDSHSGDIVRCLTTAGLRFDLGELSPDGNLVFGSYNRVHRAVWSTTDGAMLWDGIDAVVSAAFSWDSRLLAASTAEGVKVWNARTGQLLNADATGHPVNPLQGVAAVRIAAEVSFDGDGRVLVAGSGIDGGGIWRLGPNGGKAELMMVAEEGLLATSRHFVALPHDCLLYIARGAHLYRGHGGEMLDADSIATLVASAAHGALGVSLLKTRDKIRISVWDGTSCSPGRAADVATVKTPELAIGAGSVVLAGADRALWNFAWATASIFRVRSFPKRLTGLSRDGIWTEFDGSDGNAREDVTCSLAVPGCKSLTGSFYGDASRSSGYQWDWSADGGFEDGVALSSDGRRVAIASADSKDRPILRLYNATNGAKVGTVDLPSRATSVALTRTGDRVLVAFGSISESFGARLSLIDTDTGATMWSTPGLDGGSRILAFSDSGRRVLVGGTNVRGSDSNEARVIRGGDVWVIDADTGDVERKLVGHRGAIARGAFTADGKYAITTSEDATLRVWPLSVPAPDSLVLVDDVFGSNNADVVGPNVASKSLQAISLAVSGDEWVMYDGDGYFDASRGGALVVGVHNGRVLSTDQMALRFNRPDRLLADLGLAGSDVYEYYEGLHRSRVAESGLVEGRVTAQFAGAPIAEITAEHLDGKVADLTTELRASGEGLTRMAVYVNGVPLTDTAGVAVQGTHVVRDVQVELTTGMNHIEVEAVGASGIASLRDVHDVRYAVQTRGNLYFIAIGVTKHQDSTLDGTMRFASDDAKTIADAMESATGASFAKVIVRRVPEQEVTRTSVLGLGALLRGTSVDDTVVLFVAGHGARVANRGNEYRFIPYNAAPRNLEGTTVSMAELEGVLAEGKARRRLLLLDTCEAGRGQAQPPSGTEEMGDNALSALSAHDRYLYNDVMRRHGVAVFSASRGYERAAEDSRSGHGYFTRALLCALQRSAPNDEEVPLSVLRDEVLSDVSARNRSQHPEVSGNELAIEGGGFVLPRVPRSPRLAFCGK